MTLVEEVRAAKGLPAPSLAREIRRAAGVSQRRVAEELGVHPITVMRWETGHRVPRGPLRAAYARLLADLTRAVGE